MSHAILSPSSADRWMSCTPSARLELSVVDEGSDFALEGTICHAVAERIHKSDNGKFNIFDKKLLQKEFGADFDRLYCPEMLRHAEGFVAYCMKNVPEKNFIFIERKLDLSAYIEEGFGTMDFGAIYQRSDDNGKTWYWVLETFDLKYGQGVPVSAVENKQQMIYALGVLDEFLSIYPIEKVIMHIYQPRIQNNSDYEIPTTELLAWGENELKPAAALAFEGIGDFMPSDKACKFCKIKHQCRALADYNMELLKFNFETPSMLDDEEILEIYARESLFTDWIEAVNKYVLKEAIRGKKWEGYKLIEGGTKRHYTKEDDLSYALLKAQFSPHLLFKPRSLLGLGDLAANIGQEAFDKIVGPYLRKPPGAPTLAPITSTKPEYNPAASLFDDGFESEENDYVL